MFEAERTPKEVTFVKVALCGDNETIADTGWNDDRLCKEDLDSAVMAGVDAFRAALDRYYVTFCDPTPRSREDHIITNLREWQRASQFCDMSGRFYAANIYTAEVEAVVIDADENEVEFTDLEPEPGAATMQLRNRVEAILDICDREAVKAAQAVIDDALTAIDAAQAEDN